MRGRFAAAGVTALVLMATVTALGAPAASAACPNEAFRVGPSALLGECRAYEMVTPVDKESGEAVTENGRAVVGASGDEIYFTSYSAYAGAEGNVLSNPYLASRSGDAWDTRSIGGPQRAPGALSRGTFGAISRDLGRSVLASGEVLAPGAVPGDSNVYMRDNQTGTYTLITSLSGTRPVPPPIDAGTADFGVTLFSLPGGVYRFVDGRLELAVADATAASSSEVTPNVMSADGSSFFYLSSGVIYEHRSDGTDLLVSQDESGNPEGQPFNPAVFLGASPDGRIAYFQPALNGPLFRFDASAPAGERVTDIPGPVQGVAPPVLDPHVSEDGTYVYFASKALLTPDAEPRDENGFEGGPGYDLYVWHREAGRPDAVRYLGKSEIEFESGPRSLSISPDGRTIGFESFGEVTPDAVEGTARSCPHNQSESNPEGRCSNVFLYSYGSDRTSCLSCAGLPTGNSRLGGGVNSESPTNVVRPVLDEGTVLFDTPSPLAPRDVNGAVDVYASGSGGAQLVSTGTSPAPSYFIAASADGANVFFKTQQPLVGQDIDSLVDLYDARIDGGLPQAGSPAPTSCDGETACRGGAVTGSSSAPTPGSATVAGEDGRAKSCTGIRTRARTARKRSRELSRQARQASGRRATTLRRHAAGEAKAARRLGRKADNCAGGGR